MQHFDDYQLFTNTTAIYPSDIGLVYTNLGLAGEVGEYTEKMLEVIRQRKGQNPTNATLNRCVEIFEKVVEAAREAEKLKKLLRSGEESLPPIALFSADERDELVLESGDILYYLAENATHLQVDLSKVAYESVRKTGSRKKRNKIQGNGDHR